MAVPDVAWGGFDPAVDGIPSAPHGSDQLSYWGDVNSIYDQDPDAFDGMKDDADEIDVEEFDKLCYGLDEFNTALGYGDCPGLSIRTDYTVTFYRSKYKGETVCFLQWSGYEYVWK